VRFHGEEVTREQHEIGALLDRALADAVEPGLGHERPEVGVGQLHDAERPGGPAGGGRMPGQRGRGGGSKGKFHLLAAQEQRLDQAGEAQRVGEPEREGRQAHGRSDRPGQGQEGRRDEPGSRQADERPERQRPHPGPHQHREMHVDGRLRVDERPEQGRRQVGRERRRDEGVEAQQHGGEGRVEAAAHQGGEHDHSAESEEAPEGEMAHERVEPSAWAGRCCSLQSSSRAAGRERQPTWLPRSSRLPVKW
jgi:hypothetical protein